MGFGLSSVRFQLKPHPVLLGQGNSWLVSPAMMSYLFISQWPFRVSLISHANATGMSHVTLGNDISLWVCLSIYRVGIIMILTLLGS